MGEVIFINKKGVKMNILTEDEALKIFQAEDSIANDEERWVTMNGRHVLIRNGEPVGLNIKKWTGAPSKERLKEAQNETWRKRSEAGTQLDKVRNSPAYKRAQNQIKKIDKEMDGRYYNWHRNDERHAALLALREEYASQMKAMEKGAKARFDDLDKRFDRLVEVNRSGEKNGTFTNLTAKKARLERNVANAERNIAARQAKVKGETDAIKAKYSKMAERVAKSNIGEGRFGREHLASAVQRRGEEKARNLESEKRESSWRERKDNALFENRWNLNNTSQKLNALQKFKSETRPKIQSAREANRYLAERSSNIKKATPDMVGGRFRNLTGERKDILNKIRTGAPLAKQRADAEQRKADNIIGRYRDMAGRIEKRGIGNDPFGINKLANRVRERGDDLARPHSEKSNGYLRSWADRRDRLSNEYSKSVDREDAAKEAIENYRSKRK